MVGEMMLLLLGDRSALTAAGEMSTYGIDGFVPSERGGHIPYPPYTRHSQRPYSVSISMVHTNAAKRYALMTDIIVFHRTACNLRYYH